MRVRASRPPMFDEIVAVFPSAARPGVIFAWGDTIYAPGGTSITPYLAAHEAVHSERQGDDPEGWWRRYLAEPNFRLEEELPAHIAEYRAFCLAHAIGKRSERRLYLHSCATRLSSPLYGGLISCFNARMAIKQGARADVVN